MRVFGHVIPKEMQREVINSFAIEEPFSFTEVVNQLKEKLGLTIRDGDQIAYTGADKILKRAKRAGMVVRVQTRTIQWKRINQWQAA